MDDAYFMEQAIGLSRKAVEHGNEPFGAVLVKNGKIVSTNENQIYTRQHRMTDYEKLNQQLAALIDGVPHKIANLANAAALLYHTLEDLNWAGFYLLEQSTLVLGPFQGKPACIEIPVGRGVCGTAAAENRTQLVPDVHQFPGHIACDGASNSELVIPIHAGSRIAAVLDLDSPRPGRFTEEDQAGLEAFVRILEPVFAKEQEETPS